ncbi:MAG: outer membrane beta-barrel protein [Burkholderiales bacterium]
MKKYFTYLFTACALATLPATADQTGWFVGMSLGKSGPSFESTPMQSVPTREERESGYKFWGGYKFDRNFGAEMSYMDSGKLSLSGTSNSCAPGAVCAALVQPYSQFIRSKGVQLVGTGSLPVTQKFGLFGKVGAIHADTENQCVVGSFSCTSSGRNTDLTYGLGLSYELAKNFSVRSEWERMRLGDKARFGDNEVNFFTIGAGYKF